MTEGQILGRYELLFCVAQGGMARVWAARLHGSRGFRKLVAIKTILPGVLDSARLERMLLEEATLAAGIHHPNVAATFELGEQDGAPYLVMEWVDGESLQYIIRRTAEKDGVPLPIAVNIVGQMCKGLHAAHEHTDESGKPLGLVHRDISPHNVLITYSGTAKLVDFGVAKATQRASGLTEAGELKGKLAYIAPEVIRGRSVDRRADIFSLGSVLYLTTTGKHPFKGEHPGETLKNISDPRPVMPPSACVPGYPADLEAVVLRALQKDPDERWATAHDMRIALEAAVSDSFEAQAEMRVAQFMTDVAGPRGVQRRRQIAHAGEELDRQRSLDPTKVVGSQGSLRAVIVGGESSPNLPSAGSGDEATTMSGKQEPGSRNSRRRLLTAAAALSVAAIAVFVGRSATEAPVSAEAPSADVRLGAVGAPPPRQPVPAPVVSAKQAEAKGDTRESPAGLKPAGSSEPPGKKRRPTTKARRAASPAVRAPPRPSAVPAPSASSSPDVAGSRTSKPSENTAMDAWDPETYGGRH